MNVCACVRVYVTESTQCDDDDAAGLIHILLFPGFSCLVKYMRIYPKTAPRGYEEKKKTLVVILLVSLYVSFFVCEGVCFFYLIVFAPPPPPAPSLPTYPPPSPSFGTLLGSKVSHCLLCFCKVSPDLWTYMFYSDCCSENGNFVQSSSVLFSVVQTSSV